jgi:hypothetical protein
MRTIVGNRDRSAKRKNCQTGRNAACESKMRLSILKGLGFIDLTCFQYRNSVASADRARSSFT